MTDDELIDAGFDAPVLVQSKVRVAWDPCFVAPKQPMWLIGVVLKRDGTPVAIVENCYGATDVLSSRFVSVVKDRNTCGQM